MTTAFKTRYWMIALAMTASALVLFLRGPPETTTHGRIDAHIDTHELAAEPSLQTREAASDMAAYSEFERLLDASRYHPDLEARLNAISDLGDVPHPGSGAALRALLDDPLAPVREEAVEALSALDSPDSIAGLGYALSDTSVIVRRLAIEGLALLQSDEAVNALALALNDYDPALRELAIDELADIDTENARAVLQGFISDPNANVAELATESLDHSSLD